MKTYFKMFASVCAYACLAFTVSSCDKDEFFDSKDSGGTSAVTEDYDFDFSTTRAVDLKVEYNGYDLYGPVLFSVYNVNPIVNEGTETEFVDETIKPIFQAYTNEYGRFNSTVNLPAYAKVLHVVTGDFMIGLTRKMAEVKDDAAEAVVTRKTANKAPRLLTRAQGPGESTNDMSKLFCTAWEMNSKGQKSSVQVYKDWVTPLGTWNSASGRPDYLLDSETCDPRLVFSPEEFDGLYNTVKTALNSGTTCKEFYRASADLTLAKESEVTITALGSMTCWNSALGYYYYNESNKPQNRSDLNIIMLFPNTQDGQRDLSWDYQGNYGSVRGDAVQLIYYPNIANNDFSGATTIFPTGTKIGFILKPNAWSMQGSTYCSKKTATYFWDKKMNIWAASTEKMSYANSNLGKLNIPNPLGDARTAKFAYTSAQGNKYAIVSFEDACDDQDYDDLIFALNPSNIFTELATVEKGKTTTSGVYAFEDKWPERGDYDMNDVLVDCKHEMEFSNNGNVQKEIYKLTTYQNVVALVSGLALKLNTKVTPKSIVMKKGHKDGTSVVCTFTKDTENCYYLTSDVKSEINYTYTFEITYSTAQPLENLATIEPFLYGEREGKYWEVHLPGKKPTSKMDTSFFHTYDDASDISAGRYYVRNSVYPFAFYLEGASAEDFMNTILARENESTPINVFYPDFIQWSTSKGEKCQDWYLNPKGSK
jgi:LruC domain-containing protein